jgi:hypothetical protein
VTRGLLIAARQAPLAFADTESAQTLDVFRGVKSPAVSSSPGEGERPKPLTESEPIRAYAELFSGFANPEWALFNHASTLS